MRIPDSLNVVRILCLDVRIILPPVGHEHPCYWFRGSSDSPENRKDVENRKVGDRRRKKP